MTKLIPILFYPYRSKIIKDGITMSIDSEIAKNLIKLLPTRLKDNHTVVIYYEKNNGSVNKFAVFFHDIIIRIGKLKNIVDWESIDQQPLDINLYVKENINDKFSFELIQLNKKYDEVVKLIQLIENKIQKINYSQNELLTFGKILTAILIEKDELKEKINAIENYKINIINFK